MSVIDRFIWLSHKYSVFELLFPLLVIYALVYAILEKTRILGTSDAAHRANIIVAFSMAVIVTFFTPYGISMIDFLSKTFTITFVIVMALALIILFSTLMAGAKGKKEGERSWFIVLVAAFLAYLVLDASGVLQKFSPYFGVSDIPLGLGVVLAVLGVVFLIFYALFKQPEKEENE